MNTTRVGSKAGSSGRKKKEIMPYFRIAISLTKINHRNLCWLKVDPPDYWQQPNKRRPYYDHSHNSNMKNFSSKVLEDADLSYCNYFTYCSSVSIGSTVYCVGGDQDIDGDEIGNIYSEIIGPKITKRSGTTSFPPVGYVPKNNVSHKIVSRDFSATRGHEFDWKLEDAPPLLSPRYLPNIVTVADKIFIFGGNRFPKNELDYVPFGEVFDPATRLCSLIADPPFPNRIGFSALFVAPLLGGRDGQEENILVMSHAQYITPRPGYDGAAIYNVHTDTWELLHEPERKQVWVKTFDIIGTPVPVAEQDSIYWLRSKYKKKPLFIRSYNWKTKHFWEASIFGLQHESPFLHINEDPKTLLHIHQDLFCLVWDDIGPCPATTTNDAATTTNDKDFTHIHFTLLKVSRENPPSSTMSANVMGCFSRILPKFWDINSVHLLH